MNQGMREYMDECKWKTTGRGGWMHEWTHERFLVWMNAWANEGQSDWMDKNECTNGGMTDEKWENLVLSTHFGFNFQPFHSLWTLGTSEFRTNGSSMVVANYHFFLDHPCWVVQRAVCCLSGMTLSISWLSALTMQWQHALQFQHCSTCSFTFHTSKRIDHSDNGLGKTIRETRAWTKKIIGINKPCRIVGGINPRLLSWLQLA